MLSFRKIFSYIGFFMLFSRSFGRVNPCLDGMSPEIILRISKYMVSISSADINKSLWGIWGGFIFKLNNPEGLSTALGSNLTYKFHIGFQSYVFEEWTWAQSEWVSRTTKCAQMIDIDLSIVFRY